MELASYAEQSARWPAEGKVILARYDEQTIWVYQAFRPEIALPSVAAQRMGGAFSMGRMSWIKPNFLWMMYRCDWARAPGQEHVLAVRMTRAGFEQLLGQAVASSFRASGMAQEKDWQEALRRSDVRLQWDPDHGPGGEPLRRRAIQLGLRDEALRRYVEEWTVSIEDITPFVTEQRQRKSDRSMLLTPVEQPYPLPPELAQRLGM
jgi:hypothetical protein